MQLNISQKVFVAILGALCASITQYLAAAAEPISVGTSYIFKDGELVPDSAYKTGVVTDIGSIENCLLNCIKRSDCVAVVYEGSICALYNSKEGVQEKTSGQISVTIVSTEQITSQDICMKLAPCQNGGTCSQLTTYPYYKCKCHGCYTGESCQSCPPIPGLLAQESIITLNDGSTVTAPTQDGWIMLLRRQDGSVPFPDKTWTEYENGFGNLDGEFWLGNKWMHLLTTNDSYYVRFDMVAYDGRWAYAVYSNFSIGPKEDNYRIHITGYSGNAGDCMDAYSANCKLNGMPFATPERSDVPCCGGWWFNNCTYVRLTGRYSSSALWSSIVWSTFSKQIAYADMKIKRH